MNIINGLLSYLESLGYRVEILSENELKIPHDTLPIFLHVEVRENIIYMGLRYSDELRKVLEELHDYGEDIEKIVEDALSYLTNASLKINPWIREKGYITVFRLREGSNDIYEILEDIRESGE